MPHTATTLSSQLSQHHRAYKIQIAYSKKIICIIINILRARSQICSQLKLIYNHFGKIIKKKSLSAVGDFSLCLRVDISSNLHASLWYLCDTHSNVKTAIVEPISYINTI